MRRQVTCVNRKPRDNPHEGITRLGSAVAGWGIYTREQVVALIEASVDSFYVVVEGRPAEVRVVREAGKRPYLRAHAGGDWNDCLLALPECPKDLR